jgi:hypothetical protein
VRITAKSTILQVAEVVGNALDKAGIKAVLTGGACATIHSRGSYLSEDLDLIIQSTPTQRALDNAMAGIGFKRKAARRVSEGAAFYRSRCANSPGSREGRSIRDLSAVPHGFVPRSTGSLLPLERPAEP